MQTPFIRNSISVLALLMFCAEVIRADEPVVELGPMGPGFVNGFYALSNVGIFPDFQRFLLIKRVTPTNSASVELILMQNWTDELQRLVPID